MKRLLSLLILFAAVASAAGRSVDECVAQVRFGERGGSATCIDAQGYLLTCQHVTNGARQGSAVFRDGKTYTVRVVAEDEARDLALAKFDAPTDQVWTRVGTALPGADADLWGVGYPLGRFQIHSGHYLGIENGRPAFLRASFSIDHGDSGGGVFDASGSLVGVMESYRSDDPYKTCNAVSVVEVSGFLGLSWGNQPFPGRGNCQPPSYAQPQPAPASPSAPLIPQPSPVAPLMPAPAAPAPPVVGGTPPAGLAPQDFSDLKQQIADLQGLVKSIKPVPGPKGDIGPTGAPGVAGSTGPAGKDGAQGKDADPAAVAAAQAQITALQSRVTALENQLQNLSGSIRIQVQPK